MARPHRCEMAMTESTPTRQSLIRDARQHARFTPRREVNLPAKIEVRLRNGRKWTSGSAIIRNISLKGALLGKILLKKKALPVERFTLHLQVAGHHYKGIGAVCAPVRFGAGKEFELAVRFEHMWAEEA